MTFLTSTSDIIRVVTGSAVSNIEVQANYTDLNGSTYTPGSTETEITTATTTTVVAAPGASTTRRIKGIFIANNSASSCVVTVQKFNGTIAADLCKVTLRAGEELHRTEDGEWRHFSNTGAPYQWAKARPGNLGISGTLAQTVSRETCPEINGSVLTSGTLFLTMIYLYAGTVVTNISFFSATTAAGTPTNQIFSLYSKNFQLLGNTANDTTTAWAANSIKTLAMTSAYTVPVSDIYYVGIMVAATTVPTLKSSSASLAQLGARFPFSGGNSNTSLTTTMPNPCTALITGSNSRPWAAIT